MPRRRCFDIRANDGTVAIEFAMIAPIFFLMLMGIIETGTLFFANVTLTNAVQDASRLIRTGQGQTMSESDFRAAICNEITALLSCDGDKLYIDVRAKGSFASADFPSPIDQNGNLDPNLNKFNPGMSGKHPGNKIVLVRAFYKWKLFTPFVSQFYANMADDTRLISASVAFSNEPY